MDDGKNTLASLVAILGVGGVCIVGVVVVLAALWLAWPDDGTSTYSTAANVAQLALAGGGATAAAG